MAPVPPGLLSQVPGCETGEPPLEVQALAGGRGVNSVWRLRTRAGDFVLRLRHAPPDRPGSLSSFELASHRIAAAAGLAPRIVVAAPDGHWLVMEFVAMPPWTEEQLLSTAGIDALGAVLRRLHCLACPPTLPRIDVGGIARGYLEALPASARAHEEASSRLAAIEHDMRELARLSDRAVLNHGDLTASNLLGPGPLLVDWEYAQLADPTWDVACLLDYYPRLGTQLDRLLAACGLSTERDRRILLQQRRLFSGLNRLWQLVERGNWIS